MKSEPVVDALETEVDIGTPPDAGGVGCCDTPGTCDALGSPARDLAWSSMKSKPAVGFVGGILEERVEKLLGFGGLAMILSLRNNR